MQGVALCGELLVDAYTIVLCPEHHHLVLIPFVYNKSVPKLINHEERKKEIAQAVWSVLAREGIRGVSVRTVAAEAGISTGSLRHVFPSHEEMLQFSLDYVGKRFIGTLTSRIYDKELIYSLEDIYSSLSPVSEEGKLFITVAAGMLGDASTIPGIAKILQAQEEDFLYAYGFLLTQLRAHGFVRPDIDIELEVEKVVAILWGINCLYLLTDNEASEEELMAPMFTHFKTLLEVFAYPEGHSKGYFSQEFFNA